MKISWINRQVTRNFKKDKGNPPKKRKVRRTWQALTFCRI